jgi:hypothetical protein
MKGADEFGARIIFHWQGRIVATPRKELTARCSYDRKPACWPRFLNLITTLERGLYDHLPCAISQ